MNKLLKIIAAMVVSASFMGGVAAADSCVISNTGPDSVNTCTNTNETKITVTCKNGLDVNTVNNQLASSGFTKVDGNTIAGNATSGNASNASSVTTKLAAFCAAPAAVVTPPPVNPPATPAPSAPATAVKSATTSTLPNTGANSPLSAIGISAAVLGFVAVATRLGVITYGRFKA